MQIEYHEWLSPLLNQAMALKVYGNSGKPILAFPSQGGRFYDFENFGMVEAASDFIEAGKIQLYTVDSIDQQSWANWELHPSQRALRHEDYDAYITQEVVPFIRKNGNHANSQIWTTGCSMGGYHAGNFFFRHPDIFDGTITLSGVFQLSLFIGGYVDERVYFNSPLLYLPNLNDPLYLKKYRQSQIVIGVGLGAWEELMIADAVSMKELLAERQIPAWIDFWGYDVNHDWPWWRKMLPYFLGKLQLGY